MIITITGMKDIKKGGATMAKKDYVIDEDELNMFGKNLRYLFGDWSCKKIKAIFGKGHTCSAPTFTDWFLRDRRAYITTAIRVSNYTGYTLDELILEDIEEMNKSRSSNAKKREVNWPWIN